MIPYIQIVFNLFYLIALNDLHKLTERLMMGYTEFSCRSDAEFSFPKGKEKMTKSNI